MNDDERTIEILKLITGAEHHFNNLCFNIRALASTWLLATFAGIGWILKDLPANGKGSGLMIDKVDLMLALCIGSSVGIFVLWILDIRVYQQMINVWFENRKKHEIGDALLSVRVGMKKLFKTGRATELIMIYYLALTAAPLLLASFIAYSAAKPHSMWLVASVLLLIICVIFAFSPKDEEWMKRLRKKIMKPAVHHPDSSGEFPTPERCYILETWNHEDDREVSVARARVKPGVTTQLHALDGVAERYLVIKGSGLVKIGKQLTEQVQEGSVVVIPPGVSQQITNNGQEDLVFYCICSPRFTTECYESLENEEVVTV